jgi:hypothetical protein
MWVSEKLDGTRVFWDGGISRGLDTVTVPWANITNPKTGEMKAKIKPKATGLWSRYGNPIIAPDWWLNQLPAMFLDGELFAGRGNFQTLRSIVAKDVADEEAWRNVQFAAFGSPNPAQVFAPGEIKNPNFHLDVDPGKIMCWLRARIGAGVMEEFDYTQNQTFEQEIALLQGALMGGETCYLHQHTLLPDDPSEAEDKLDGFMDWVLNEGGEGVMLRKPNSIWTPKRVSNLLKLKPFVDDSGTITGFISGRETDKGSKLRGLIGAIILDYNGKRLELAGFTLPEREFDDFGGTDGAFGNYAYAHPGVDMPADMQGEHFKVGDTVEFRYRELSDAGIPKEARYLRHV